MIRKNVLPIFLILISYLFLFNVQASEESWKPAQEGNKIIFIRHSIAPGGGDPKGFKIKDCKTQRNLNQEGINQSRRIGKLFKEKQIKIHRVLSSQ